MLESLEHLMANEIIRGKTKKTKTIEACKHLNNNERTFSKLGKFTITEQLQNTKIEIERKIFLEIEQKIWLGIISFY